MTAFTRTKRWGFDLGGTYQPGLPEDPEYQSIAKKPVTIRNISKRKDEENIKLINPFKK